MNVLDSPSLIVLTISVDVKQHRRQNNRAQELCGRQDERPGLPVPSSPYGLCGRKTFEEDAIPTAQELCERQDERPGLPVPIVFTVSVDVKQY